MQARDWLCGACENYTLPDYSCYIGCVKCEDYEYGWLKFVAAAFVPLTAFYILVIVFRMVSQTRGAPSIICDSEIFSYIIRKMEITTSVLFLYWALMLA